MPTEDSSLSRHYERIHDTPMQRKLRRLAPMPVGAVFIEWPGMTDEDIRGHFRAMKQLGYTCLKQIMHCGSTPAAKILHMALDEGILPFWYAEGGYEDITPELLKKLGLPAGMSVDDAMAHPKMIAHQHALLRRRIDHWHPPVPEGTREDRKKALLADPLYVPGVNPQINGWELAEEAVPRFVAWLQAQYADVETLKEAWNVNHSGGAGWALAWTSWDDVGRDVRRLPAREYRHLRDILRFKADTFIQGPHVVGKTLKTHAFDPHEPVRAGGEMGVFLPFASRGTDMEGIARAMAEGGSFYPSMHPSWHLEEVEFEFLRPTYMQASICADWAKGVWSATWESTGGPQYFSGGKAPFVPAVRDRNAGFTIDAGAMRQLMFSYLAAGFRGFGMWCWNPRSFGWEAGEYALTDRNNQPTERAIEVGRIGQAAVRYRREIWDSAKEPVVGVLQSWDSDAFWAAMSVTGRDKYKSDPIRARIGVSRALLNANVPWEYVTDRNLLEGLAPRYKAIYLPAIISISPDMLRLLADYVRQGGRVVMDLPGGYYDAFGKLLPTGPGSAFEQLFGVNFHELAYANNVPFSIAGVKINGFAASMTPTTAKVVKRYNVGGAAITENRLGKGSAVLLGCEAAANCLRPGNAAMEKLLVTHTLGKHKPGHACKGALVLRLASPTADHYFLLNDGPARKVTLATPGHTYRAVRDAVTDQKLALRAPIALPAYSGRWLRFQK